MGFFENWFQKPKQPSEEDAMNLLPDDLRSVLVQRKYEEDDVEASSVLGSFETADVWWSLAKRDPATVRTFEKTLAAANQGSLPEWYQTLSLGRHVIEPLHELEADFQALRTKRQQYGESPIGGGGEVTEEMRSWYERVKEMERRVGEKKLQQEFMELERNLNLKLIDKAEYDEGVERLEAEYHNLQASLDVSDTTIRELADIENINRLQEVFAFLVQDWIDSLRNEAGQIDPELAGMIAADVMMRKLRELLETTPNPKVVEINQAIQGWILLDGNNGISDLTLPMKVWRERMGDRLKFSYRDTEKDIKDKLVEIRKLIDDTLPSPVYGEK